MPHLPIEFKISNTPVPYEEALVFMEQRVAAIIAGEAGACIWFLQHPPLYTAGTSAKPDGLLDPDKYPVYAAGRGGEYTYHGPGQLVAYVMMDLKQVFAPAAPDLKAYIARLEQWIIATLADFGVEGFIKKGMIGVWVDESSQLAINTRSEPVGESAMSARSAVPCESQQTFAGTIKKVAAIGVRVKKWVAFHGICLNVAPNLEDYKGIVPCGITDFGVTSLEKLGINASMEEVRAVMQQLSGKWFVDCG